MKRVPAIAAIVLVVAAYAFFATAGTFDFPRVSWDAPYPTGGGRLYASLAEGFRRGQLSLAYDPDPRLATLHDPYSMDERIQSGVFYVWDASYFKGKYYIYFSPLPVLLFYLPYRVLRGAYPPDALPGAFFCAWSFLMIVLTTRRALAGRKLFVPLPVWILLIGLGNLVPFSLNHMRVYQVAIVAGMAMSATWAYALLRFLETGAIRHAVWMGVWLALAIAARPNLGIVLAIAPFVIPLRQWRVWAAFIAPLAVTAIALAAYNYARYRSLTEFGHLYQLTMVPMRGYHVCGIHNLAEVIRFFNNTMHYLSWPFAFRHEFPWIDLLKNHVDEAVSFPGSSDYMIGVGPLNPLTMIGTAAAAILVFARRALDAGTRAGLWLIAGSWLILAGLAVCWYVLARYSLDFMMLMIGGAAIAIEAAFAYLAQARVAMRPLRIIAIALACYGILIGTCMGFSGPYWDFKRENPALFEKLSSALTPG